MHRKTHTKVEHAKFANFHDSAWYFSTDSRYIFKWTYHTIHLHTFVLRLKAAKLHILPHYGGTKIRQMYRNDMVT